MRALEETMDDLSGQLRSGQVVRKVQINDRKVLDRGVMETVRIDTGAVIESRPLTEDEKQPDLPF